MQSWESYQKVLFKLVKRFTGLTVEEKLREDAEQLFIDVLLEKFDGVDHIEIQDIKKMIFLLAQSYPQELENASKKCKIKTYQIK